VTGDEVLTDGGTSLGKVRDVVVLVGSNGEVVGYEIETASGGTGYIPLPVQLAVSGSTLVVPEATKEFVEDDLVGLGRGRRRVSLHGGDLMSERFAAAVGRKVVSRTSAEELGKLAHIVVDVEHGGSPC
jgi:sporulation protein YlmC with PRC-barrel domain